ncbi:MAG: hypothetical protein B6D59_03715 [Campylobacteraceae bacterium 4484_4]|nr:MAG: hypothetical protein B6D59_03715 [Campylobacteraceae bacterium 4484_4]
MQKYIIFTDLDGTLLNHEDYTYDEALPMLKWLQNHRIPVVFTTSKTRQECEILQEEMGLHDPFIVENGAAIYEGEKLLEVLGEPYEKIRQCTGTFKEQFSLLPFSAMSVEEVMERTGFSYLQAKMAKEREYSEPFLIRDERRLTELEVLAETMGLKILKGGRFYHCVGINQDKGEAVRRLKKRYPGYLSIGLGDNYNDVAMLDVVEVPILIPHHKGRYIEYERKGLIRAKHKGSLGWRESLEEVLHAG